MRVACLVQEHNAVLPPPGLQPGPLDHKSGAITIKPQSKGMKSSFHFKVES